MVLRAVLLATAALFLAGAVGFGHLFAWLMLQPVHGAATTAAILAVADLVLAGGLALLAARDRPDAVEIEARMISRQAWQGVRQGLDWWALIVRLLRAAAAPRRPDREAGD